MEHRTIKPKDDALVVRHNKLIEARYETTLHQQRIMLWLISEIRPEDRAFQTYRVTIKELAKFVGLEKNKNVYQQMAEATKGMVGRLVEIGSFEQDNYLQVGLISSAKYKVGEGFIDLEISPQLVPYLLDLKANFTKAYLRDLMAMKSAYSIRLYDLLNQYRKAGRRSLTVDEIKTMLGISKKYKAYKNFKARVINPSIKEINERTDLFVSYKERKAGRSVETLEFLIQVKEVFRRNGEGVMPGEHADERLIARLMSHGLKEEEARKMVLLYSESEPERIPGNLDKLEEGIKAGKVKKPVAWIRKAIDEDWRDQKSLFQKNNEQAEKEAEARRAAKEEKERAIYKLDKSIEQQETAYLKYRQDFVKSKIESLNTADRKAWENEFPDHLTEWQAGTFKKNPEWWSKLYVTAAEQFIDLKTGETGLDQDEWFAANDFPKLETLEKEREALL